jgi:hypothetical protein
MSTKYISIKIFMEDADMPEEKNSLISDIAGLSKPLEKLIDCTSRGIGIMYQPHHIRKMADARAYEIKVLTEAFGCNIAELTIDKDGTTIKVKNEVEKSALDYMINREVKKFDNNTKIIQETAYILNTVDNVSDEPVDDDWLSRFFNIGEDISNEYMQNMWSKILADEIVKPNSYSLRTLETLKNISTKEAKIFEKFVKLSFITKPGNDITVITTNQFLASYGLTPGDINLLRELNLIDILNIVTVEKDKPEHLIFPDNSLLIIKNYDTANLIVPCNTLTTIGREISNLINKPFKLSIIENISKAIKSKGNVSISLERNNNKLVEL